MKRAILSKLNPTQHRRIGKLIDLCCQTEPIRLSIPLPKIGEELQDERFFALYDNGTLVSLIHLFYPDHLVGELIGFTHPDYRGRGYFRRLLDLASDHAEEIGLSQVYVISDGNSAWADRALEALGLNAEYSEYMMEKSLDHAGISQPIESGFSGPETPIRTEPTCSDYVGPESLAVTETSASLLTASLFSEVFRTDIAECESYLEEISSDPRIRTYVLTQDGTPIGQTQLTFMDDMAYISGFGILPEYRRQGYGLKFLQRLEQLLAARSVTKLTLQVSDQNKTALSLYRKDGFETLEALHYYPLFEEE